MTLPTESLWYDCPNLTDSDLAGRFLALREVRQDPSGIYLLGYRLIAAYRRHVLPLYLEHFGNRQRAESLFNLHIQKARFRKKGKKPEDKLLLFVKRNVDQLADVELFVALVLRKFGLILFEDLIQDAMVEVYLDSRSRYEAEADEAAASFFGSLESLCSRSTFDDAYLLSIGGNAFEKVCLLSYLRPGLLTDLLKASAFFHFMMDPFGHARRYASLCPAWVLKRAAREMMNPLE